MLPAETEHEVNEDACLRTARDIGAQIRELAIWHGGRCNWVGALPEEGPDGRATMTHAALGPDLYGGTAGVALFLAQLWAVTGEASARDTAMGAIRQALSRADDLPPTTPSVYTGRLGVALAAARVGALLGELALWDEAVRVAVDDETMPAEVDEVDLLLGAAGVTVGSLVLYRLFDDVRLLDRAVAYGDHLVARAQRTGRWWSWSSPSFPRSRDLTGYSHGAAGVGLALLELSHATGQPAYREAALQGFAYERELFDRDAQNWPDLRRVRRSGTGGTRPSFPAFWCHGAPGIALSRLRAYELLGDETCRVEAVRGLETTGRTVRATTDAGLAGDYSLCHGFSGSAEVLLEGRRVLGGDVGGGRPLATEVAARGIEHYADQRRPWPCGTHGGQTPALFLGLAGTGLFYLRLVDPAIPSVLLLRPEALAAGRVRTAPTALDGAPDRDYVEGRPPTSTGGPGAEVGAWHR